MNDTLTHASAGTLYENLTLDEERALYGITRATVKDCLFDGPADGESALKEASDITVESCEFRLRYPFWHVRGGRVVNSTLTDTCRAALWYAARMTIENTTLGGIKALRECDGMTLTGCEIHSAEFGWLCRGVELTDCKMTGEYPFFMTRGLHLRGVELKGKYSFQYVEDCTIANSCLDTKDAFWHARNITVMDSTVKGEYLGWYSEGLTLVRCATARTSPSLTARWWDVTCPLRTVPSKPPSRATWTASRAPRRGASRWTRWERSSTSERPWTATGARSL